MYEFPTEMRRAYEASALSFVYYENVDGQAVPVLASGGFCKSTGADQKIVLDWLATGMFERMHPDDVGLVCKVSGEFLAKTGPYDVVFRCRIGDDYQLIHGLGNWQTMPGGKELAVIGYANVTKTREALTEIVEKYDVFQHDRFYSDSITRLPNLNYLHEFGDERARVIKSEGHTPTVVFSDVFSMQSYNSQYGIKKGDDLLRLVAQSLQKQFPDALLVRGANDHFIMVTDVEDLQLVAERIELADNRIRREAYGNTSGIRSGICSMEGGRDVTDALDHARHALRRIDKDMTRVAAVYSKTADDQYWQERYIIEHFDQALEQGQIKVFYQGIRRTASERLASFEALARWIDPNRGTISPAEFIPALQRYHQLYRLDLHMFEQVCREVIVRHDNGLQLVPVSINFSRQDFDHVDVVSELDRIYDTYELSRYVDKSYFIIEVTEQDLAEGIESFHEQLARIHDSGYGLWLDDFGSGYSSFSMLSQFNFDLIKFDMEMVRHLDDNGGVNRVILRGLVNMSRELGIHTLIEGLENECQLKFMREIGIELVQGFYFHRPEPLSEILYRLERGDVAIPCETEDERAAYHTSWLERA